MSAVRWSVVVPVKAAALGKTRLAGHLADDDRVALVRAMAADTLRAAAAAPGVAGLLVVTTDAEVARDARAIGTVPVHVEPDPDTGGLGGAVAAGLLRARRLDPRGGVAVLLGDLPALRPGDLGDALAAAGLHPRAVVVDAKGSGTTLLTAAPGAEPRPRFGGGSARAHTAEGHVRLDVPLGSSVRQDVDVVADLAAAARLGVGPRTAEVLARLDGRTVA